jgi:hypothetical protein
MRQACLERAFTLFITGRETMRTRVKAISVLLAIVMATVPSLGCGEKGTDFTVSPSQGASVTYESLTIDIPRNAVSGEAKSSVSIVSKPPALSADLSKEEAAALSSTYNLVGNVYDVQVGAALEKPATVTLEYSAQDIPAGFTEDNLFIVQYVDGEWRLVESKVDPATRTLSAQVPHFSLVGVCAAFGVVVLAGIGAMVYSLLTQPAFIGTAHRYLTPTASSITSAVSSGKFVVDVAGKRLVLTGVPLKGVNRDRLARPRTGAEMMADATGMCEDFSNLFGSLLIAAGYPVRAVGGNATYLLAGNRQVSGGHAWIEVLIDKNVYYVDTFDTKQIALIPIEEARRSLNLKPGRMWGKTTDGKVINSQPYDELWPLVGEWKLTRTKLSLDHDIPDEVLNTVIPRSPTWKLEREADGKLKWNYDGGSFWFKTLGQSVTPGPTIVEEGDDAISCTMSGSGSVFMDTLPLGLNLLLRFLSSETKKVENITVRYEDEVAVTMVTEKTAIITVTADITGTYTSVRENDVKRQDSFGDTVLLTYTAEKQE